MRSCGQKTSKRIPKDVETTITRTKWRWIGHNLIEEIKTRESTTRIAVEWLNQQPLSLACTPRASRVLQYRAPYIIQPPTAQATAHPQRRVKKKGDRGGRPACLLFHRYVGACDCSRMFRDILHAGKFNQGDIRTVSGSFVVHEPAIHNYPKLHFMSMVLRSSRPAARGAPLNVSLNTVLPQVSDGLDRLQKVVACPWSDHR